MNRDEINKAREGILANLQKAGVDEAQIKAFRSLVEMSTYATVEDIPESLRKHVYGTPDGGFASQWFKHPFYVSFLPMIVNKPIEELLAMKEAYALERLREGELEGYLRFVERPFRMDKLIELGRTVLDRGDPEDQREFWEAANWVWTDAEGDEKDPRWTDLLDHPMPGRDEHLMSTQDREAFDALPDWVDVYRGVQAPTKKAALNELFGGWSWTTQAKTASFFAQRFLHQPNHGWLMQGRVPKACIEVYLTGRGEAEALIDPVSASECVKDVKVRVKFDGLKRPVHVQAAGSEIKARILKGLNTGETS